jgi:hypothetical protein
MTITPVAMPPMAVTPAAPMNLHDVRGLGILYAASLTWQRARALRRGEEHCGCNAKGCESFVHFYTSVSFTPAWATQCPRKGSALSPTRQGGDF